MAMGLASKPTGFAPILLLFKSHSSDHIHLSGFVREVYSKYTDRVEGKGLMRRYKKFTIREYQNQKPRLKEVRKWCQEK